MISGTYACAPSGNDTSPSRSTGGAGGASGASGSSSSGVGIGGSGPGDINSSGGSTAGAGGSTSGMTGTPGGTAGGAAGAVAPAADPIQAVDDSAQAFDNNDYAGAIADAMASLAADPDGPAAPAAHYVIARSQQQLNDCTMAMAGYQEFLQSYPDDADFADDAQFRIGECYYETGDYATALTELQKVLDNYPGSDAANDAQYTIGLCYYEQAKAMLAGAGQDALLDQARAAFQAAIDDYPERAGGTTSPLAQYHIGLTYHLVGDCTSELAAMQKVISDYPVDPNDPSASTSCTATADHLAACDVNSQRQAAIDSANQHIMDINATLMPTVLMPGGHTCM